MHELPVTQSICDIAVQEADRVNAKKVTQIWIKQGDYTDYVPEIIQEYFNLVSEGTKAENAVLNIERVPAEIYCNDCKASFIGQHYSIRCTKCGGRNTVLKTGKEFYIDRMEIED